MLRFRLLLAACMTLTFALVATAFHSPKPTVQRAGSVSPAGQMVEARSGHTATLLPGGKVLIVGGMRRNQDFYKSAELYDPGTRKFVLTGEMHESRVGQIAVLLRSGKVLIAGGWVGHGATHSAELYDPASGRFTALAAKMTARRGRPTATLLPDGDVLIAGGGDHDSPGGVASAELFEASTLTFHGVSPMNVGRVAHTATLLRDGRVLIAGGRGDKVNASAEIFDPKTKRFARTGSLITARYKHTAGLLPDGRVLIAGGSDERDWKGNLNSAEVYDPERGTFQPVSSLNDSRFKLPEEAISLGAGQLLIAGGSRETEVFDSGSGRFLVAAGQMNEASHFMTTTKLQNGEVLLAGGYPDNDQATDQAWIYRP